MLNSAHSLKPSEEGLKSSCESVTSCKTAKHDLRLKSKSSTCYTTAIYI